MSKSVASEHPLEHIRFDFFYAAKGRLFGKRFHALFSLWLGWILFVV